MRIIAILFIITSTLLLLMVLWQHDQLITSTKSLKDLIQVYEDLKDKHDEQQEDLMLMENHMNMQSDSIANLVAEVNKLRSTSKTNVKPTVRKNEKVIPISTTSSKYYLDIFSKRYQ